MKIGQTSVSSSLNANPHTGRPQPKFGTAGKATLVAGTLPKRSRGGGAGNPLGGIQKEWLDLFQSLAAPQYAFRVQGSEDTRVTPTDENGDALKVRVTSTMEGPDFTFWTARNEECKDVLFVTEAGEDGKSDTYTAEGVEPLEILANVSVTDAPSGLNKLYNAMVKFNKATGKTLRMLSDANVYDENGGIKEQRKIIWRMT